MILFKFGASQQGASKGYLIYEVSENDFMMRSAFYLPGTGLISFQQQNWAEGLSEHGDKWHHDGRVVCVCLPLPLG